MGSLEPRDVRHLRWRVDLQPSFNSHFLEASVGSLEKEPAFGIHRLLHPILQRHK